MRFRVYVNPGEVTGFDSCIMVAPAWLDSDITEHVVVVRNYFQQISEQAAATIGERLHHADWEMTDDPEVVKTRGLAVHDCASCQAGVDQGLAYLRDNPGKKVLAGLLYWTS